MNQKLANLDAMGIDVWVRREFVDGRYFVEPVVGDTVAEVSSTDVSKAYAESTLPSVTQEPVIDLVQENISEKIPDVVVAEPAVEVLAEARSVSDKKESSTGITPEVILEKITSPEQSIKANHFPELVENDTWEALDKRVQSCLKCDLHKTRQQPVFGVGDPDADWLIIGEAPGAEEDRLGEPFVGRAGQLLNSMLKAVDLNREQVFIANILKCRPPDNRDPRVEEVSSCEPYLQRQIELIKPKIILCVGRIAAQNLLKVDTPIGKMRGKKYSYEALNIPVVVTYHPAYLLRTPKQKTKSWQDLLLAKSLLEES